MYCLFIVLKDDKVSEEEWLKMWTDCIQDIKSKREFPEWQQKFIDFMFKVNDTSGMEHVGAKGVMVMVLSATLSKEIEIDRCPG